MIRRALTVLALMTAGCHLAGTGAAPQYVCAAQDAGGARLVCDAPDESYPGDGCKCVTPTKDGRSPDVYYGRVVAR